MAVYSSAVMSHFKKPHNFGKLEKADGVGEVGNIICGDVMYLYIKVGKNKQGEEIIKDIKFETYGCVAAIATSSVITDLARGKTIDSALKIQKDEIVESLESLPPIKLHCSFLATDALREAIYDYLKKKKRAIPEELMAVHRRVEEDKVKIESRYKDWVKMERDLKTGS